MSSGQAYRIAIVEDDLAYQNVLKQYLRDYSKIRNVFFDVDTFSDGLTFVSEYRPNYDIIFMDIEMPHLDGMKAAYRIREIDEMVCLVFVTNLIQYAVEGYAVRAMDFIVKPVEYGELCFKMDKVLQYRDRFCGKKIVINAIEGVRCLQPEEIYYIEVMDHTLIYHTSNGEISERGSISVKEKELLEYDFGRCNNSFLVNMRHVIAIENSRICVGEQWIPIGRTKKKEFMQRLTEFIGAYMK